MSKFFSGTIGVLFLLSVLSQPAQARNRKLRNTVIGIGIGIGVGLLANELSKKGNRRYRKGKSYRKSRRGRVKQGAGRRKLASRMQKKSIQNTLNTLGFDAGTPDGIFGHKTREAIKQFQESRGEPVTGSLTREQRFSLLGKKPLEAPGVVSTTSAYSTNNIDSVQKARKLFREGRNPYIILAKMKNSFAKGQLKGLTSPQRRWLATIQFSAKDQPLLNYREGFGRLFSNGLSGAYIDARRPGAVQAIQGGGNSKLNDRSREQIGMLYEGEPFMVKTNKIGQTIDYPKNYLINFFSQQDRLNFTALGTFVAVGNLHLSQTIDIERVVTRAVNRRANHSDIESERLGNALGAFSK